MFKKTNILIYGLYLSPFILFIPTVITGFTLTNITNFLINDFKNYTLNTFSLIFLCVTTSIIISFFFAYIFTFYKFKYSTLLETIIILPLAIPTYIAAYSYGDILSPTGRLYQHTGILIDIHSFWGLAYIYTIFLYPYIYLPVRAFLSHFNANIWENAQLLGHSQLKFCFKVVLPLSLPAIAVGSTFLIFELLSDYGASNYLGVETYSRAIHTSWFVLNDYSLAFFICLLLIVFFWGLMKLKNHFTENEKYSLSKSSRKIKKERMNLSLKIYFIIIYTFIALVSFFIPIIYMIESTFYGIKVVTHSEYVASLINTIILTTLVVTSIMVTSIIVAAFTRNKSDKYISVYYLGYMFPSTLVALFVYVVFINIQNVTTIPLTSTIIILIVAYIIRFVCVGIANINTGFKKQDKLHVENSKLLKKCDLECFRKIELPQLKTTILTTILVLILEVSKELNLALFLRPFGYETLATKAFTYANDERIVESSMYSLTIVVICMICIIAMQVIKGGKSVKVK